MDVTRKHSEYQGNVIERYKQAKDDEVQAAQDIEEQQGEQIEKERERIEEENAESGIGIDKLMQDYAKEDRYHEYLVDGASLKCTRSTTDVFRMSDGTEIPLGLDAETEEEIEDRKRTTLHVCTPIMSINDKRYATVRDVIKYQNIVPFRCNCEISDDRDGERERIKADANCGEHGVCRHLMELSAKWDNVPMGGMEYMKKSHPIGVGGIAALLKEEPMTIEEEGITMTSVLFCRHGGIIYPETSGQVNSMKMALAYMDLYLQGEVSEVEIEKYIIYVSQNCGLPIAKIVSGDFQGRDVQNDFDKYILAWSYYWNGKIAEGAFGNGRIAIRPDVVKAIIMAESSWGTDSKHNGLNDVTQALVPGDYALWILSGYDPTPKDKSHFGNTEQVVWVVNEGNYMEASMRQKFNYYYDNKKTITITAHAGFGVGMGILQKNVISVIGESGEQVPPELANSIGEYLIHYDAVTPNMSIACGIAHLASKIENANSEKQGVVDYNGGGAEKKGGVPYKDRIDQFLGELGYDDGSIVKPLQ